MIRAPGGRGLERNGHAIGSYRLYPAEKSDVPLPPGKSGKYGTRSNRGPARRCNVRDMEGLSASVVLIAILLGVLLVVVFDVFCLLHLGTADSAPFVPRFAWAVLIVVASPIGGLGYLLAQRLRTRWPEPVAMRPRSLLRNEPWQSPTLAEYRHAPSTPLGHGVAVMAITVAAIWLRRARSWRPRRLQPSR